MSKKHTYVLGLNAYDHDVSACLLRDGEIAFAIEKERITRRKHASGFYKEVIDYCLRGRRHHARRRRSRRAQLLHPAGRGDGGAAGLLRHAGLHARVEREQAAKHPLYLSHSDKVVTISHHLAHAYSAFAACPFEEGVVMIVDGVGSYRADVTETVSRRPKGQPRSRANPRAITDSRATKLETLKKVWMEPTAASSATNSTTCRASARSTAGSRATSSATGTSAAR